MARETKGGQNVVNLFQRTIRHNKDRRNNKEQDEKIVRTGRNTRESKKK